MVIAAFLLATCLRVKDIDAILVFLSHRFPVQVSQCSGCVRCLHDVRGLHHLRKDRNPAWTRFLTQDQKKRLYYH